MFNVAFYMTSTQKKGGWGGGNVPSKGKQSAEHDSSAAWSHSVSMLLLIAASLSVKLEVRSVSGRGLPGTSVLAERSAQTAPIGVKAPIWVHGVDAASASPPSPDMNVRNLVHMCQLFLWERKESWWGRMTCVWVCVCSVKQDSHQCFGSLLICTQMIFFSWWHYLDYGDLSPL